MNPKKHAILSISTGTIVEIFFGIKIDIKVLRKTKTQLKSIGGPNNGNNQMATPESI
jgi:hypothetical protein